MRQGKSDWLFYIGKYEVTEKQFATIMSPETPTESTLAVSDVSYIDMLTFTEHYNTWLRENHADSLPKMDESLGYLRLPTEVEWEFSARGGIEVDPAKFDESQPYGKLLNRSEWFSGPRSSHDQKQKVGVHQPNPLGLHDMLGNVSELTLTPYQLEYFQGRLGGLTAKGGNFHTQMKDLRSSMRTEIVMIQEDGRPTRLKTLGFRLVIGSPVFAGAQTIQEMRSDWKGYSEGKRISDASTEAQAASQFAQKAQISIDEAQQQLEDLETQISQLTNAPENIQRSVSVLKTAFGGFQSIVLRAEQQNANAWSRMSAYFAFETFQELQKLPQSLRAIEIAKNLNNPSQLQLVEQKHQDIQANIQGDWSQFIAAMEKLYNLSPERVQKGFANYIEYLTNEKFTAGQIRIVDLVQQQYLEYAASGRLDSGKMDGGPETTHQPKLSIAFINH